MISSLDFPELSPLPIAATDAAGDGSCQAGLQLAIDLIVALDPLRERAGDEILLGRNSALPLSDLNLESIERLQGSIRAYKQSPTGSGFGPNIYGFGPAGAQNMLVMAGLQASQNTKSSDNSRAYLSECGLLRSSLEAIRDLGVMPAQGYADVLDSTSSWKIGLGGFTDPTHPSWGRLIIPWASFILRDKLANLYNTSYLSEDIARPSEVIPSAGRANLVGAVKVDRLLYLAKYVMRRPGFRLIAHVLDVLLQPQVAAYLKITHELGWPKFEELAKSFLTKELFPPLMNFADKFVGSAVFHGVGGAAVSGYIYDRDLWGVPLSPLPPDAFDEIAVPSPVKGEGKIGHHFRIEAWGRPAEEARIDPTSARLFELRDEVQGLWDQINYFLRDWERLRIQEEAEDNLVTAVPKVLGFGPHPTGGLTRVLGGKGLDYTVLGGQFAVGPAARANPQGIEAMLVSPVLNAVIPNGEGVPTALWRSALAISSMPIAEMLKPQEGSPLQEPLLVYVLPQNLSSRQVFAGNRFNPIVVQPIKKWKGEPGSILITRNLEAFFALAGHSTTQAKSVAALVADVRRHPERWAHLLTLETDKKGKETGSLLLVPGGELFESDLTRSPYLVPVALPRTALTTRLVTWSGPPAGLRPFRGWLTGADVVFNNIPYMPSVDMSAAATALASDLAGGM